MTTVKHLGLLTAAFRSGFWPANAHLRRAAVPAQGDVTMRVYEAIVKGLEGIGVLGGVRRQR
jgi:hypothetical protein